MIRFSLVLLLLFIIHLNSIAQINVNFSTGIQLSKFDTNLGYTETGYGALNIKAINPSKFF